MGSAYVVFFQAHSGLRYLVLATAVVATIVFAVAQAGGRPAPKRDRAISVVYTSLVDLQVLLGIGVLILGPFRPILIGHIVMMIGTAAAVHVSAVVYKRRKGASVLPLLLGTGASLLLIIGGILALGRGLFTHSAL
jgi:hypothetical protein